MMDYSGKRYAPLVPGEASGLIDSARAGNRLAISRLVNGSIRLVILITYRYSGIEKDELFSISFPAILDAIKDWEPGRGSTWSSHLLYKIRNRINRELKYRTAEKRKYANTVPLDFVYKVSSPIDDVNRDILKQEVLSTIPRLPNRDRMLIRRRLDNYTLDEIGQKIGITKERVRQCEKLAIEKLRRLLDVGVSK